jgi:hypothetical protein
MVSVVSVLPMAGIDEKMPRPACGGNSRRKAAKIQIGPLDAADEPDRLGAFPTGPNQLQDA